MNQHYNKPDGLPWPVTVIHSASRYTGTPPHLDTRSLVDMGRRRIVVVLLPAQDRSGSPVACGLTERLMMD